ncbi:MAG: TROVE domain-containing protein [Fimbriimonas sp.]
MKYSQILNRIIPQTQPLNKQQVRNAAGGYVHKVDQWQMLDRFLLLGTCGGTYYTGERDLTKENVDAVLACIAEDGTRVVARLLEIDLGGRAPKKGAANFALALVIKHGDGAARAAAYEALPRVCRTGSHLFDLLSELDGIGKGWSRALRRSVGKWYTEKNDQQLAYQAIKYGTRAGWSHRDALRLAHPKTDSQVVRWLVKGGEAPTPQIEAAAQIKTASVDEAVKLIVDHRLPREAVPSTLLGEAKVWEALLADMPLTALIRNLGKMTSVELVTYGSDAATKIIDELGDLEKLRRARVHPLALLVALKVYAQGCGVRGALTWTPVSRVVSALNEAIGLSFGAVPESRRREMVAIDVSGSMRVSLREYGGLMLHEAAACMALATIAANPSSSVVTFDTGWRQLDALGRRWDDLAKALASYGGGTDFSQAIEAAMKTKGEKPELLAVYTDNETWAGQQHPEEAWADFKKHSPNARCVVASMTATGTVAMPCREDVLQVVGFDTALPEIINAFGS